MKKIFITGASGFLGQTIVRELSGTYQLYLLEHTKRNKIKKSKNIKIISGGLSDISKWGEELAGIDVVVHLAGVTHSNDQSLYKKINTDGTIALARVCAEHNVKQFIYISTRAIGPNCGEYGESKREAENFLKKNKIRYTILRVGEVWDDEFKSNEGLGKVYRLIKNRVVVPVPSDARITLAPIKVCDVCKSIRSAVLNPKAYFKTYVIAGPEVIPIKKVFLRIAKSYGWRRIFIPIPTGVLRILYGVLRRTVGVAAYDQLDRLLCKKEPLSKNVFEDLKISPERFVGYSE